jgi:hypothetical protein
VNEVIFHWRDWLPLATAIAGLFLGAIITELHVALAGGRERRRALNVLLFDLLQLRFDVCTSNPRAIVQTLIKVAQRKFGAQHVPAEKQRELQSIIGAVLEEVLRQDRVRLTERFTNAIQELAPHDAILAYRLAGRERLTGLENAIRLYYLKVSQHPDVIGDSQAPQILGVMQEETTTALIEEVLKELAADIERIARVRSWWPLRFWTPYAVKRAIRNQGAKPTNKMEQEIEALIDRLVPTVVSAVASATSSAHRPDDTPPPQPVTTTSTPTDGVSTGLGI